MSHTPSDIDALDYYLPGCLELQAAVRPIVTLHPEYDAKLLRAIVKGASARAAALAPILGWEVTCAVEACPSWVISFDKITVNSPQCAHACECPRFESSRHSHKRHKQTQS
jgi:hypothetical protein